MDPLTIITALSAVAPTLIKWATGSDRAEQVATIALDAAKGITGQSNLDDSLAMLKANPELQLQFQTAMLNRDSEFEKLYVDDKKDARAMQIALASTPQGNVRANWLVGIAILIIVVILFVVIYIPTISEFAKGALTTILGVFLQQLNNIYSFEFGTTRRSREKTDAIDTLTFAKK